MTGFKDFSDGVPLTASDIDEYLMQGVLVFDSASARDTALSGNNREGRVAYLKDTNTTTVYNGSAWVALGLQRAAVSATTGSPATDTTSRPGKTIYTFTAASGSITFSTDGYVELLVVGGGGGGQAGSFPYSGGGGDVRGGTSKLYWVTAGEHAITVGAGGTSSGTNGGRSSIGTIESAGGGIGNKDTNVGKREAGGAPSDGSTTNSGAGGAGGDGSAGTAGAGVTSTITGSSVEYGRGGLKNVTPTLYGQGAKEGANAGNAGVVIVVVG